MMSWGVNSLIGDYILYKLIVMFISCYLGLSFANASYAVAITSLASSSDMSPLSSKPLADSTRDLQLFGFPPGQAHMEQKKSLKR